MRVVCNKEDLAGKVALAARIAPVRSTHQVHEGILVEAGGGEVSLAATDIELSIRTALAADVEEEGRVLIPARIFNDIVRSLPEGRIELEHDSSAGVIRLATRGNEYKIRAFAAEEFSELPELNPERSFTLAGNALIETVDKVSRSYSRDETRPVLTGVLINFEDSRVRMVTTDSYRLSIKETPLENEFEGSIEAIVPARALQEVKRIYGGSGEEGIQVSLTENQAVFGIGDVVLGTNLIAGSFPEYRRLLPEVFEREISVPRRELLETLRRVSLFVQRQNPPVPVSLAFSRGELEVMVRSQELGEARERLSASSDDEFTISFNPEYLLDGVSLVDSENVIFKFNESLKPGMIVPESEDGEEGDFLYLIMPMRDPYRS
ncbi:DNA polymerase III subunit beta [Rubrobacter taiwanensis]|uniref:DNA polymerase III subunit beta n=1 Tax=Rubrobacter taiwanensis TaxID=185139 RepID=UPI001404A526|nr:DNA polymerase III subunit beta [Rubrobacter taiwanensis]